MFLQNAKLQFIFRRVTVTDVICQKKINLWLMYSALFANMCVNIHLNKYLCEIDYLRKKCCFRKLI